MGKYEEALERAKAGKPLDEVFPELKESEDERFTRIVLDLPFKHEADYKFVRVYLEKQKEQQSAEWSEEDEIRMESCMLYLANTRDVIEFSPYIGDNARESGKKEIQKDIDWLKSLRPQPKQDVFPSLREKEIICLKRALDYLRKEHNRYGGEDFTNEIVVLEWLITHPILVSDTHWKPSEEQMEALKNCVNGWQDIADGTLESLYNDLKSL